MKINFGISFRKFCIRFSVLALITCTMMILYAFHCISKTDAEMNNEKREALPNMSHAVNEVNCEKEERDFMNLMEAVQQERQATMRQSCRTLFPDKKRDNDITFIDEFAFYSKTYQLSVCHHHKCGFSSWIRAMSIMENIFTMENFGKTLTGAALVEKVKSVVTYKAMKTPQEKAEKWKNSVKVTLVRHPFSRVVSAYYDKMVGQMTEYYVNLSREIIKEYKAIRLALGHTIDNNETPTLEDFVNYLVRVDITQNPHWLPYYTECDPCHLDYDYIAKFETLTDDMNYLRNKLNISTYHNQAFFPRNSPKISSSSMWSDLSKLPKNLLKMLYKKYEVDFRLYGYDRPDDLLT